MAPDLGLDLKLSTTKIISNLSKDSSLDDAQAKMSRLEQSIKTLEEERRKIEVFKRELPQTMYILDDVIGKMKEELEQCRKEPIQEFMPMSVVSKSENERAVKVENDCLEKKNWMSSAQLWSDSYSDGGNSDGGNSTKISKKNSEESAGESDQRSESIEMNKRTLVGAFVPLKGSKREDKIIGRLPDLTLLPVVVSDDQRSPELKALASCHVSLQSSSSSVQRKSRRCWSPELHRRFVAALHQLGGAQVATPKQIRELMKVDGLTNDEVKSHLQKFRLHTRRSAGAPGSRPMATMGCPWGPPESNSQSGSPQGPLQMAGSSRAVSTTAGDSCDDNSKSESYSWK